MHVTGGAQLLVTPRDFRDPSFKANLRETTEELLNMARVVPVFNENDAISDRTRARPARNRQEHQPGALLPLGSDESS